MTGLVPGFRGRQTEWRCPPKSDHACVAPLSAANIQIRFPLRHTAGAVKRSVPDGVETICSSWPSCARVPRSRASESSRIFPSLPPCATSFDVR